MTTYGDKLIKIIRDHQIKREPVLIFVNLNYYRQTLDIIATLNISSDQIIDTFQLNPETLSLKIMNYQIILFRHHLYTDDVYNVTNHWSDKQIGLIYQINRGNNPIKQVIGRQIRCNSHNHQPEPSMCTRYFLIASD